MSNIVKCSNMKCSLLCVVLSDIVCKVYLCYSIWVREMAWQITISFFIVCIICFSIFYLLLQSRDAHFTIHELYVVYFSCVTSNIFHVEDYCKTICDICCSLKVVYTNICNFHLLDILNVCKCQHYHRRCTILPLLFFWEVYSSTVDRRVTTGLTYEQLGLRPKF